MVLSVSAGKDVESWTERDDAVGRIRTRDVGGRWVEDGWKTGGRRL